MMEPDRLFHDSILSDDAIEQSAFIRDEGRQEATARTDVVCLCQTTEAAQDLSPCGREIYRIGIR